MRYYIIAGEPSGDLHGSRIIESKKSLTKSQLILGWRKMKATGGEIVKHVNQLSFMGFWEVLVNINIILENIRLCKRDINAYHPDKIIYIDYPGFNMLIAKWAKKRVSKSFLYKSSNMGMERK